MKLIIEIPEEQYNDIVKYLTNNDGNYAYSDFNLREIIRNGTPYNPSGDVISREALKEQKVYSRELHKYVVPVCDIDKAQAVEQDWRFYYNHGYAQAKRDLERPKGEWIRYRDNPHQPEHIKCSICGQYWSIADHDKTFDFCFKCGADMRPKGGTE